MSDQSLASSAWGMSLVGLIPATDNRPDGNAYVPGDVVTMYDGTTVEVLNTDALGIDPYSLSGWLQTGLDEMVKAPRLRMLGFQVM